jgi:hypothetical protein
MRHLLSAAAAAVLLTACASPLPQTPPAGLTSEIAAPAIKPGSLWRYAISDGFTHLPRGSVEYRVAQVSPDRVSVDVRTDQGQTAEIYTHDWNWLLRPATNLQPFIYQPAYPAFQFPLAAGKKWSSKVTATDPADSRSFPVRVDAEVLGWEKVQVPAGEFDTLKVRRLIYFDYFKQGVRGQSVIIETDWYAPSIGQIARKETTSRYWRLASAEPRFQFVRTRGGGGRDGDVIPRFEQDDWFVYVLTEYSNR